MLNTALFSCASINKLCLVITFLSLFSYSYRSVNHSALGLLVVITAVPKDYSSVIYASAMLYDNTALGLISTSFKTLVFELLRLVAQQQRFLLFAVAV